MRFKRICLAVFLLLSSVSFLKFGAFAASCGQAVLNNITYTHNGETLPINTWVQVCAFIPGQNGATCAGQTTEAGFEACLVNQCPFLPQLFQSANNPQAAYCLSSPAVSTNLQQRVELCANSYNEVSAAACKYPDPKSLTVSAGNSATFETSSNGNPTPTVAWQASTDNGATFVPIGGANAPAYTLTALLGLTGNQYRAEWTNLLGPVDTNAATLTVNSPPAPATSLFVSNGTGGLVEQYNGASGTWISDFATVNSPQGIITDPLDGSLLVASASANQILKFNGQTGAPMGAFVDGTVACSGSTLAAPAGITFGADNNLYVADQNNDRVVEYDGVTGACLGTYASGSTLNLPNGLVFGRDGYLYVANLGGTVARFAPSTGAAAGVVSVGTQPAGIAISPLDDNLYVTDNVSAGQVYVISRSNFLNATPTVFVSSPAGGLNYPDGLIFGPDSNLYVASNSANQVQQFNGSTGILNSSFVNNVPNGVGPTFLTFNSSTSTAALNTTATFSPSSQPVTLSATVTNPAAAPVNSGTVTFSVFNGGTQIGSSTSAASVSNGTASATFTLPAGTPAGTYSIQASYSGSSIFLPSSDATHTLTVNRATPVITWNQPAAIVLGTPLGNAQLNATANTAGNFVYTPLTGTVLQAGANQQLSVAFTPADSTDYTNAGASVSITVNGQASSCVSTLSALVKAPTPGVPGDIQLYWLDTGTGAVPVDHYDVYRSPTSDFSAAVEIAGAISVPYVPPVPAPTTKGQQTRFIDGAIQPGMTYYYRVASANAAGAELCVSNQANATAKAGR